MNAQEKVIKKILVDYICMRLTANPKLDQQWEEDLVFRVMARIKEKKQDSSSRSNSRMEVK